MEWLWCWRSKVDMPMLDEQEFAEIASLHTLGLQSVKEYRADTGVPLQDVPLKSSNDQWHAASTPHQRSKPLDFKSRHYQGVRSLDQSWTSFKLRQHC
jgi:hypothetical protein